MGKPKTMAQLSKLARERIGPEHFCESLLYPRGVFMGTKFGGAPTCTIRTGNSASARLLMEQHILAVGEMIERSRAERWMSVRKVGE